MKDSLKARPDTVRSSIVRPAPLDRRSRGALIVLSVLSILCLGVSGLDLTVAQFFHAKPGGSSLYQAAYWLSIAGEAGWYLGPAAVLWAVWRYQGHVMHARLAGFLFWGVGLSALVTAILKVLIGRGRPITWFEHHEYGFARYGLNAAHQSFPSGHATTAMAAAFALSFIFPRFRFPILVFGLAISVARTVVYAHFVSDIIAGTVVAWITVSVLRSRLLADLPTR